MSFPALTKPSLTAQVLQVCADTSLNSRSAEDSTSRKSKSRSVRKSKSGSGGGLSSSSVKSGTSAGQLTPYISCESRSGEGV